MGYSGKLAMLDGITGKPRTIINIEKAAKLTAEETGAYPRFRKSRERDVSEPPIPETGREVAC
jgi:hypothetical protein